jgi:hypothetical protein
MGVISCGTTMLDQGQFQNLPVVNWDTTAKTANFTAVAGNGYFVNTTAGAISVNLPAGTAGDVVAVKDYAQTFETNPVTLVQNGSDKIGGSTVNPTLSVKGLAATLVFVDATQGWLVTGDGVQSSALIPEYIAATGGTITTCGDFKIHTFTGPGTFCVSNSGNSAGSNTVDYLVIAGGGGGKHGGGAEAGGGGGAGGYRESSGCATCFSASPSGAGVAALPVTATGYPIAVGGGGDIGVNGNPSSFSIIASAGGGRAGLCSPCDGAPGGSGGGARAGGTPKLGGAGNTPVVSPPQGNDGGNAVHESGGSGGGGAGAVGYSTNTCTRYPGIPSPNSSGPGGNGGCGQTSSITGSPVARAGGGGGGSKNSPAPSIGFGKDGGGDGGGPPGSVSSTAGTANTGGGGGGGNPSATPPATVGNGSGGGSGVVIIRYKYQ